MSSLQVLPLFLHRFTHGGAGYIAGEPSDGLVTINGAAGAREFEVRHRRSRAVVATGFSREDGTYRVDGLDPDQVFDCIARDWAGIYNDTIVSRVTPEPYDVQSATGAFVVNASARTLGGAIDIYGGEPGHEVAVTAGTEPTGITFAVVNGGPPAFAHSARWLIPMGAAAAGDYTWTLTVSSRNGTSIDIPCTATFT